MNLKDIDHKLTSKESDELRKQLEMFFEYDSHAKLSCYDARITVYLESHEIY